MSYKDQNRTKVRAKSLALTQHLIFDTTYGGNRLVSPSGSLNLSPISGNNVSTTETLANAISQERANDVDIYIANQQNCALADNSLYVSQD